MGEEAVDKGDFSLEEPEVNFPEKTVQKQVPEISYHVLDRQTSPKTIRLTGSVKGHNVQGLIDSGSTHNFIQSHTANKLCLTIEKSKAFKVFIGNGDYLLCEHKCHQVPLKF